MVLTMCLTFLLTLREDMPPEETIMAALLLRLTWMAGV
jgi:hypothetical protein